MEREMLGVSPRDHIRNKEIKRRTRITNITERITRLKWQWVGNVARRNGKRWTSRVLKWRSWENERKVGRPMKRWDDDIETAAQEGDVWKELKETYRLYRYNSIFSSEETTVMKKKIDNQKYCRLFQKNLYNKSKLFVWKSCFLYDMPKFVLIFWFISILNSTLYKWTMFWNE